MIDKVNIAIIDDGVNANLIGDSVVQNIIIHNDLSIAEYLMDDVQKITHGTLCAGIIKYYSQNINIYSIKILSETLKGNIQKLYIALEWCAQNNIQVANVSLGSHFSKDYVVTREIINQISEMGVIVVCASNNAGHITYPASLSNVIGVKRDAENQLQEQEFYVNDNIIDGIEFTAFAKHKINLASYEKECSNSNSFAAPMITAKVCQLMGDYRIANVDVIKSKLISMAKNYDKVKHGIIYYPKPDWMNHILICYVGNKGNLYYDHIKVSVCSEITITQQSIQEDFDAAILDCLEYIETVVIITDRLEAVNYLTLQAIASKHKKNIVFIDEHKEINISKVFDLNLNHIKMWHNSFKFFNISTFCGDEFIIEEPVVSIYLPDQISLDILFMLQKEFDNAGYNAYFGTNNPLAVLYDLDYIPETNIKNTPLYLSFVLNEKKYDIAIYVLFGFDGADKLKADLEIQMEGTKDGFQVTYVVDGVENELKHVEYIDHSFISKLFDSIVKILS